MIRVDFLPIVRIFLRSGQRRQRGDNEGYEKRSRLFDQRNEIVDNQRSGVQGVSRVRDHR